MRASVRWREGGDEIFHRRSWWSERPVSSLSTTVLGLSLSSLSSTMSNNPPQSWVVPSTINLRPKDEMRSLKARQFLSSGFSRWILKSPVTNRVGDFMTNRPSRSESSEKIEIVSCQSCRLSVGIYVLIPCSTERLVTQMYSDWNHHWADVVQLLKT